MADSNKLVKLKDKEAHNLHQKLENSLQTSKNLKENIRELKKDKTSSDKSLKLAEKIFKVTEDKLNEKIVILEKKLALQPELNTTIFSSTQANSNSPNTSRCHLPSKSGQDSFYSSQTLYISPDMYRTPCSTSAKICTSSRIPPQVPPKLP